MPVELKESPIQKATASGIFLPPSVEEFNAAAPVPDLAEFQAAAPVTPAAPTLDEFQAAPRAVHIPSIGPSTAEFSQAPQNPDIGKLMERTPQELAADDAFSPVAMLGQYGKDLPPDLREKLYEIYDAQDARPWEVGRTAKAIGRGLWETGKSGVRAVAGAAAGEAKLAWAFAKDMLENNMEVRDSTLAAAAKIAGESVASIDEGILQARDLATLVSRTAGRVYRAAPVPGVPGVPGEVTGQRAKVEENPEARRLRLREDLDADAESFRRHTNVAQGGGVVSSLAGVTPERLQAAGVTLDPEAIADKSLFNGPMTFIPMGGGKLFEVIGLGGKTIGIATEFSLAKLFKGAGWAAEKAAAPVVGWVGKEAPLGGAVTAGPGGWVAGKVAHAVTKGTEWGLKRGGAALAENALPIAKLATPAVAGAIEGGLASAPFALGAHTDMEAGQLIGTMAFFGGFGGATRQAVSAAHEGVARAYQARYQEVARDPVRSPAFNIEPNLDQAHTQAIEALRRNDSPTAGLINRVREYFRGKAELYLLPVDQFAQDPRVLAEVQREHPDFTPEQLIAEARGQRGFTVRLDPTEGRGPRKVMLLNGGDAAVYHEPGHVLDWLLRETDRPAWEKYRADLATHVNPIRPALEELYGGKGATGNILDEASAETLGAILRGRSLNGAPPGVLNSAFTALGSLFEKAGIVRPTLDPKTFITGRHGGLTPSFTGRQLAEPVFRSLETPVLAERLKALEIQPVLRPAPGVPGAVPIRAATTGAQASLMRPPGVGTKEFVAQAKDIEGLSEARRRTQASPKYDDNAKAVMDQVWELLQREHGDVTPVELDYARPETVGENVARYIRRAERLEVELQRKADGTYPVELLRTLRHQAIFYGVKVRGDNVNLLSMNLDILLANALRIGEFSARKKAPGLVPYETGSDGHFTEPGFRDFAADVTSYLRNHAHGYGGDGTAMHPPAGWQGVIPAPDPNWKPTLLDPRKAQFINASMGLAPPKTGRVAQRTGPSGMPMPAGMAAQILAEAHGRPLTPAKGAPVFKKEALAKKGIIVPEDVPVMETNPLRAELVDAGFDAKGQLHEVTQELSLEQIRGLTPRPESLLRMPSTDLARAGFMPKRDVTLVGPNGERVAATHDGDQDASVLGLGMVRQITPKESFPGAFTARSTTYEPSLNKKGWTVEDAPATTEPLGPTPQRPIDIPDGMVGSSETNPDRPALPGESAGLTPAAFMPKARGSEITEPADTYGHAVERGKGNLWVRQSGASDNSNRVLLMQFTKDMMYAPTDVNKPPNPLDVAASAYYDKLYAQRKGYARLPDFWEVPQWHAVLTHALGEAADLYVVRDMAEAKSFLATAGYQDVAFSVLDVNKSKVAELADANPGHTVLGGYTDTSEITSRNPRATRYESIDEYVRSLGLEYKRGFDYRLYRGSSVVPRLDLSQGCRHACKFCTVTKKVVGTPPEVVTQQVDAFGDLNAPLAYLNDKTFGQHDSYLRLPELYAKMKAANPDFGGFVIQTTAAQMKSFSDEFLRKSGIKFIELGVESYNDSVLKGQRKPANEKLIDAATEQMRRLGIAFIPNIVIGLPGETAATYAHTMDFLRKNSDVISHANIYNLAVYEGSELSKELKTTSAADVDENVLAKSFHTDPAIHENFAREIYDWASQQLDKTPGKAEGAFMTKSRVAGMADLPILPEDIPGQKETGAEVMERSAWRNKSGWSFKNIPKSTPGDVSVLLQGPDNQLVRASVGKPRYSPATGALTRVVTVWEPLPGVPRGTLPVGTDVFESALNRLGWKIVDEPTGKAEGAFMAKRKEEKLGGSGWLLPDGRVFNATEGEHARRAFLHLNEHELPVEEGHGERAHQANAQMYQQGALRMVRIAGGTTDEYAFNSGNTSMPRTFAQLSDQQRTAIEDFAFAHPDVKVTVDSNPLENRPGAFMAKRKESEDKLLTTYARRLHRAAWREYGDTEKWKETGYLLPDGTQLDFTGKGPDAPPGDYKRTIDHSSIAEAVGENMLTPFIAAASKKAGAGKLGYSGETSGLTAFVNSGAIRIMPELPGAEISSNKEPSEAQYRKLESFFADPSLKNEWGEVAVDLVDQNGYARDSRVYPAVTNPTVIINDIKEFYRAGHLPSRTSSRVAQFHGAFMPQAFEKSKEVADELAKVREGTSSGQTFTGAGKVWDRKDQKVDIVTVASENVLTKALTPAAVQKVADRYEDVLAIPGTAMGVFKMDDPTQTSIDVNALPDQKHRDNTIAFGKFNQQQAIYDTVPTEKDPYGHSIPVGGTGKTVLTSPAQIAKAVQALLKGENAIPAELPKPPEAAMMAKRGRREEPEKLETSGWIDPDGKFRSIQGSMHEDWLARNSAKLNAEYGTDFANVPDIAEREKAIREGFIRVRYEPRTGTLAIEASENAWTTDAKDKIFQLVRENLDDIDHMRVNILNGKMKIVDGGAANLVEYEGIDKLDHLPLISDTGAQRAAFMPKPKKGDAEQAEFGAEVTETDPQAFARDYARRVTQERVEFHPESVPVLFKRTPEGEYIINAKGKPLVNMVKYTFDDSPLSRQAAKGIRGESARQDAQTTAFAKKIAEEARAIADPDVLAGKSWYQETVRLIKEHFKTDAEVTSFAQLLAATSARTDVAQNFKYALEAYNLWKEGKFDDAIASYKKAYAKLETGGLLRQWQRENNSTIVPSDAALKEWWIESRELSLVRENEKQFGQNSDQVLRVLSGTWAEEVQGLKTQQFAKNLAGTDHGATIDVWASRTMKRLGWDGLTKSPWRLLPRSEGGITDPAFLFAQEAFAKAAKELHMQPDDLQALMWFQEKKLWGERGWTRGAGEELASFEEPLKKLQRNEETGRLEIRAAPTEQPLDLGLDLGDINSANFMPKRASQNEKMMSQGMPDAELQRLVTDDRFRRVDKNWHRVLVDEWERRQRLAGAVKPATQSAEKAEIRPK